MSMYEQMQAERERTRALRAARHKKAAREKILLRILDGLWTVVGQAFHIAIVMLVLGLGHEHFAAVPALGFWDTALVVCGIWVLRMVWRAKGVWRFGTGDGGKE